MDVSQEAMPVRLKSIHIINANSVATHTMALIRPFVHKELFDLVSASIGQELNF